MRGRKLDLGIGIAALLVTNALSELAGESAGAVKDLGRRRNEAEIAA